MKDKINMRVCLTPDCDGILEEIIVCNDLALELGCGDNLLDNCELFLCCLCSVCYLYCLLFVLLFVICLV